MERWLRLWMSYLKTAGLAMAVFTALAFVYGAIRLGSDWVSLVAFGCQVVGLLTAVLMWYSQIRRLVTNWLREWWDAPAERRTAH